MHLNIAHKIFGIALIVLVLTVTVAVFSVRLTARISAELDDVASTQLPLSYAIGRINVRILEQGLTLQQIFALDDETPAAVKRIEDLGIEIEQEFEEARALFQKEEKSGFALETVFRLDKALSAVEAEYREFEKHSLNLLKIMDSGDLQRFRELLPDLNKQQAVIDQEIDNLREHISSVADDAVKRADAEEKYLLYFNAGMTALAAILGLGFAGVVTFMLVRNVRNLVRGTEQIENGNLDVVVPVVTRDEVGRLTGSFNTMTDGLRMKERIKDTFGKYMDPRVVASLLDRPELTQLGGERREMTVMFIDLQGYTTISEKLPPQDLVHMLNLFLGNMTSAISENTGVINDFQGDAVMAYWGPPFTGPNDHATLACKAALKALENFEQFKQQVANELGEQAKDLDLGMRVGISTGKMVVGNIGSSASRKYSVIGDPVNLGARLEGANKNYGTHVILSERTRELAGDDIYVRELDLVRVKGKSRPTRIFELLKDAQDTSGFLEGLSAYRDQRWQDARQAFESWTNNFPNDPVPRNFLERIAILEANPPGKDWDGVWAFTTK